MRRILLLLASAFAVSLSHAMPTVTFADINLQQSQRMVLFVSDTEDLTGAAAEVNTLTDGRLAQAIKDADFEAEFGASQTFYGLSPYAQLTVVGTGENSLTTAALQDLGGYAAAALPAG